jgi:hypothetical protein
MVGLANSYAHAELSPILLCNDQRDAPGYRNFADAFLRLQHAHAHQGAVLFCIHDTSKAERRIMGGAVQNTARPCSSWTCLDTILIAWLRVVNV